MLAWNQCLDYLTDPKFKGINRFLVLSHENIGQRRGYKWNFHPTVEIKDYNVTNDKRDFFDQPVKNHLRTYDNIRKK